MGNGCSKGSSASRASGGDSGGASGWVSGWASGGGSGGDVEGSATQLKVSVDKLTRKLQDGVKDVSQFEEILNYIGQAIDKLRNHPNRSIQIPEVISSNLDDAEKALDAFSNDTKSTLQSPVGENDFWGELEKALGDVFSGVGNLHWITAAFSMVALVLKRLDQMQGNTQSFLDILESLHQLGMHLVDLFKLLPQESNRFWKASSLVVGGAILCVSQLNATRLKRFAYVSTSAANISQLKEQVSLLYQDLSLILEKENLKRTRGLRSFYKPEDCTYILGREETIADILAVLQPTSEQKYQAVLLHGMGGIGKTTLAETLIAKISATVKNIVKVHVGENPTNQTICGCQSSIYERLMGEKSPKVDDPSDGRRRLQDCLERCSPPIILYIDNVFSEADLRELLPRKLVVPKDSRILVTSRYERISQAFASSHIMCRKFHITGLGRSNAEALLARHLGGSPKDEEGQRQFNCVLNLCDGWPLALEVVGAHLRDQKDDVRAWDSIVTNLKGCKGVSGLDADSVKEILKWSSNKVTTECQSVFLDLCYFLRAASWDVVVALGIGSELHTLKALSMVKKVEDIETWDSCSRTNRPCPWPPYRVGIHDLFVALGKENEAASKLRRLCYDGGPIPSILEGSEIETACNGIEGLALRPGKRGLLLPAGKLDAMHRTLRILQLGNVQVQGECLQVPRNLQLCSVECFPYKELTGLNNLRVLELRDPGNMNFADQIFPRSLQVLDLICVDSLIVFHEEAFKQCVHLHRLSIERCNNLTKLPASVWGACRLRVLELSYNWKLESLPAGLNRLHSLETFLCRGSPLREFPSEIADLKKLRYVSVGNFGGGGFRGLSRGIDLSQLSLLEHLRLDLRNTNGDLPLLHGFGALHALRTLHIEHSKKLEEIGGEISRLENLTQLSFRGCKSLRYLPDGVPNLLTLTELDLTGCEGLIALPNGFARLMSLEKLLMKGCDSLMEVPKGLGNMELLSELDLRARNLKQRPDGLSQLTSLRSLSLQASESSFASSDISTLIHLKTLFLDCQTVAKLPLEIGYCTVPKKLGPRPSGVMIDLPPGCANLESLSELSFSGCERLVRLPDGIVRFASLRVLRVKGCEMLEELPSGFGNLVSLTELLLDGCKSLVRLPDELCQLSSLRRLDLSDCEALETLPSEFGNIVSLNSLRFFRCKSLRKLPDGWANLVELESLVLVGCSNLQQVPDSVCELKVLIALCLYAPVICQLPERIGYIHSLKWLDVSGCEKLEALPESLTLSRCLKELLLPSTSKVRQSEVVKQLEAQKRVKIKFENEAD